MTGLDAVTGANTILTLWKRGSLLLWALCCASAGATAILVSYQWASGDQGVRLWTLAAAIAAFAFLILAGFKTYQDKTIRTMAFTPDEMQSFFHHALQTDGRKLTQLSLRGKVSNISQHPIYPTRVRLVSPRGQKMIDRHVLTEHENGRVYGFNNSVPVNSRSGFSADFFVDGFIGKAGKPMTVKISITDQFGHSHPITFVDLPNR